MGKKGLDKMDLEHIEQRYAQMYQVLFLVEDVQVNYAKTYVAHQREIFELVHLTSALC